MGVKDLLVGRVDLAREEQQDRFLGDAAQCSDDREQIPVEILESLVTLPKEATEIRG